MSVNKISAWPIVYNERVSEPERMVCRARTHEAKSETSSCERNNIRDIVYNTQYSRTKYNMRHCFFFSLTWNHECLSNVYRNGLFSKRAFNLDFSLYICAHTFTIVDLHIYSLHSIYIFFAKISSFLHPWLLLKFTVFVLFPSTSMPHWRNEIEEEGKKKN